MSLFALLLLADSKNPADYPLRIHIFRRAETNKSPRKTYPVSIFFCFGIKNSINTIWTSIKSTLSTAAA
jgi:hypothetical protein